METDSNRMGRRQFISTLAVIGVAPLAGCGHPPAVLDMDVVTAADIADEVSTSADPGSERHTVVTSARENGSATRSGRNELFDNSDPVQVDGTFYEVSETQIGNSEVTVYDVRLEFDPDDSTPEIGEIEYDDLPEQDLQRLGPLISEGNPSGQGSPDIGVDYGTAEEVGNESVFVPERQYDIIVRSENRYRVAVNSRTASEAEYRYEATEIAPDVDTFADQSRERYLFAFTALSDAERAVVEEAIDEAYFEDDDAFQSVVDRIREHEGLDVEDFYGTWLLEYDGVEYLTYAEW